MIGDTPPTRAPSSRLSEPCLLLLRLFIKQHILCGLMETGTSVRGADSGGCQGLPWSVWLNVHEQFIIVCNFSGYVTNGIWYGLRFKLMSYISVCIICIYLFSLFGAFICYIVTGLIFTHVCAIIKLGDTDVFLDNQLIYDEIIVLFFLWIW